MQRIISKALEKDRALRYQSAAEMLADLKRLRRDSSSARVEIAAEQSQSRKSKTLVWAIGGVVALALLAGAAFLLAKPQRSGSDLSVAVMPFVNASNDPNSEYLSDGITESLINNLSQLPNLVVMARSSVFRYKGRDVDPQTVAKELKVQALVTGRIVQHGDQLIISSELIDARTSRNLWGDQYDRKLSDALAVQQEITSAISAKLRERLSGETQKQGGQGRHQRSRGLPALSQGPLLLGEAHARDSGKSQRLLQPGHSEGSRLRHGVCRAGQLLRRRAGLRSDPGERSRSQSESGGRESSVSIDPSSAEAHAALAGALWSLFDFSAAEAEFQRALELNPNLSNAHHWYGLFLSWEARHPEAITHLRRAIELDPLNLQYQCNLGQVLANAGQSDAAVEQLKKALEMDPNFTYAHVELRQIYRDTGKYDLAMEEWKKYAALNNDPEEVAIAEDSAKVYAKSGIKAAVAREIEMRKELGKRRYQDPSEIAYLYAPLGDKEQAFAWLDKARAEKSGGLEPVKIVRALDQWHSDPRYIDLLKQLGLPQ